MGIGDVHHLQGHLTAPGNAERPFMKRGDPIFAHRSFRKNKEIAAGGQKIGHGFHLLQGQILEISLTRGRYIPGRLDDRAKDGDVKKRMFDYGLMFFKNGYKKQGVQIGKVVAHNNTGGESIHGWIDANGQARGQQPDHLEKAAVKKTVQSLIGCFPVWRKEPKDIQGRENTNKTQCKVEPETGGGHHVPQWFAYAAKGTYSLSSLSQSFARFGCQSHLVMNRQVFTPPKAKFCTAAQ